MTILPRRTVIRRPEIFRWQIVDPCFTWIRMLDDVVFSAVVNRDARGMGIARSILTDARTFGCVTPEEFTSLDDKILIMQGILEEGGDASATHIEFREELEAIKSIVHLYPRASHSTIMAHAVEGYWVIESVEGKAVELFDSYDAAIAELERADRGSLLGQRVRPATKFEVERLLTQSGLAR